MADPLKQYSGAILQNKLETMGICKSGAILGFRNAHMILKPPNRTDKAPLGAHYHHFEIHSYPSIKSFPTFRLKHKGNHHLFKRENKMRS